MNFALSAIVIVFLLLPGAIAVRAYYSSLRAKDSNTYVPFNEQLLQGILATFIIHASLVCIITRFLDKEILFDFLYNIIIGRDEKEFHFSNREFAHNFLNFSIYIISATCLSYAAVKIFKYVVHGLKLDYSFKFLRNANHWYSIFNLKAASDDEEIDIIILDVFVKPDIIYSGYLVDFDYSPLKDELESLVLKYPTRRKILNSADSIETPHVSHPVVIPGNRLILLMNDVININIRYLKLEEELAGETTESIKK